MPIVCSYLQQMTKFYSIISRFDKKLCHIKCNHPVNFHCTYFIAKDEIEWPPNSPELNPLDSHVWGAMPQAFHKLHSNPKTIAELTVHSSRSGMTCRRQRSTKLLTTFANVWTHEHRPRPVVDILNRWYEIYTEIFWLNSVCCFRNDNTLCVLTRCLLSNSKTSC